MYGVDALVRGAYAVSKNGMSLRRVAPRNEVLLVAPPPMVETPPTSNTPSLADDNGSTRRP